MDINDCIAQIVDEKKDKNIPDDEIYSFFIKSIHYLQAAKDILSSDSIFAQETAMDFYNTARREIGLIRQEPPQELNRMIHSLSLYAQKSLKYGTCDDELPEMNKMQILPTYCRLDTAQKSIIDFYFTEQLTQLKQEFSE